MRLSYNAREPVKAHYPKSLQRKRLRIQRQGRGCLTGDRIMPFRVYVFQNIPITHRKIVQKSLFEFRFIAKIIKSGFSLLVFVKIAFFAFIFRKNRFLNLDSSQKSQKSTYSEGCLYKTGRIISSGRKT